MYSEKVIHTRKISNPETPPPPTVDTEIEPYDESFLHDYVFGKSILERLEDGMIYQEDAAEELRTELDELRKQDKNNPGFHLYRNLHSALALMSEVIVLNEEKQKMLLEHFPNNKRTNKLVDVLEGTLPISALLELDDIEIEMYRGYLDAHLDSIEPPEDDTGNIDLIATIELVNDRPELKDDLLTRIKEEDIDVQTQMLIDSIKEILKTPEKLPDDLLIAIFECYVEDFKETEIYLQKKIVQEWRPSFVSLLKEAVDKNKVPLFDIKKAMHILEKTPIYFVDLPHSLSMIDRAGSYAPTDGSIKISVEFPLSKKQLESMKETLYHEYLHALSARSLWDTYRMFNYGDSDSFTVQEIESNRIGIHILKKGHHADRYFSWINEALTEEMNVQLFSKVERNIYAPHRSLLHRLVSLYTPHFKEFEQILLEAYFEDDEDKEEKKQALKRLLKILKSHPLVVGRKISPLVAIERKIKQKMTQPHLKKPNFRNLYTATKMCADELVGLSDEEFVNAIYSNETK